MASAVQKGLYLKIFFHNINKQQIKYIQYKINNRHKKFYS